MTRKPAATLALSRWYHWSSSLRTKPFSKPQLVGLGGPSTSNSSCQASSKPSYAGTLGRTLAETLGQAGSSPAHTTLASAQSAWSLPLLAPASATSRSSCTPETSTSSACGASAALSTPVSASSWPSPST